MRLNSEVSTSLHVLHLCYHYDTTIYIYVCIMVTSFHLLIARPYTRTVPLFTICSLPFRLEISCGPNLKSSLTPWAETCVALCHQSSLVGLSNLGKPKNVKYNSYLILQNLCNVNQRTAHFSN